MENLELRGNELPSENCLNLISYSLNPRCAILSEESTARGTLFLKFETFDVCFAFFLAELKCIRTRDEDGTDFTQDLAKSQRYTLQLERQLRELLQSPQGSGQFITKNFMGSYFISQ